MTVTALKRPMVAQRYGAHRVALPVVELRLRRGDRIARPRAALVDTGATFTLCSLALAAELGLDEAAVKTSTDVVDLHGAGAGPKGSAWGWTCDLYLGDGEADGRLVLPGARVYFTAWGLAGYPALLGHHDVLERLTFSVLNHPPSPGFVLRFPSAPRR